MVPSLAEISMSSDETWIISVGIRNNLFPQKLAGCEACHALEKAGEMMREIETEQARGLADVVALHQQTFRLIYYIIVDVADGCAACGLVDNVSEIAG